MIIIKIYEIYTKQSGYINYYQYKIVFRHIFSTYPSLQTTQFLLSPFNDDPDRHNWKIQFQDLIPGLRMLVIQQKKLKDAEKLVEMFDRDHDGLISASDIANEILRQSKLNTTKLNSDGSQEKDSKNEKREKTILKNNRKILKNILKIYKMDGDFQITTDEFIARTHQIENIAEIFR